jgi:hypothetical protein
MIFRYDLRCFFSLKKISATTPAIITYIEIAAAPLLCAYIMLEYAKQSHEEKN